MHQFAAVVAALVTCQFCIGHVLASDEEKSLAEHSSVLVHQQCLYHASRQRIGRDSNAAIACGEQATSLLHGYHRRALLATLSLNLHCLVFLSYLQHSSITSHLWQVECFFSQVIILANCSINNPRLRVERDKPHAVVSSSDACHLVAAAVNYVTSDVDRLAVAVHSLESHAVHEAGNKISTLGIETHVVGHGAARWEGNVLAIVAIFNKDGSVTQVLMVNFNAQVAVASFPFHDLSTG